MDEMIDKLVSKVGLDRAKAEQVVAFLREHAADVPRWLAGNETAQAVLDRLPGGLGDKIGDLLGGGKR